jgi:septum formation protein
MLFGPSAPVQIILASRSPRRKKALRQIVSRFRVVAVAEPARSKGKSLVAKTRYLALVKAKAAARRYLRALIIAADTLACCNGKMMGKAANANAARLMLKQMSGQRLDVVTSIAIAIPGRQDMVFWSEYGWVKFRKLEPAEISHYIQSSLWIGKAAAINVEEKPVRNWIVKKGGEWGAVVGLPTKKLGKVLRETGMI